MNSLSIIVPIFNEEQNIQNLFNEFINNNIYDLVDEIIYIDDFSIDDSLLILNSIKKINSKVVVLNHKKNYGQSKCFYTGINFSKSKTIITIDGDGQNNPKDILKLLNIYFSEDKIALVGGIRHKRKDTFIKRISSKIANNFRKTILNDECDDTGCSLKIFDRETFMQLPFFNGMHRFLPALFKGRNKKTKFVNVDHRARIYGSSNYGTFNRLFNGIFDIIRVLIINYKYNKQKHHK